MSCSYVICHMSRARRQPSQRNSSFKLLRLPEFHNSSQRNSSCEGCRLALQEFCTHVSVHMRVSIHMNMTYDKWNSSVTAALTEEFFFQIVTTARISTSFHGSPRNFQTSLLQKRPINFTGVPAFQRSFHGSKRESPSLQRVDRKTVSP